MILISILPDSASLFIYLLICIAIIIIYRFGFGKIKYWVPHNKESPSTSFGFFVILMMLIEIIILLGLFTNMAIYYSAQKNLFIKILFHLIAIICIGAELTNSDRKLEKQSTINFVAIIIIVYFILISWDWLRDSVVFTFLFNWLK